MQHIQPRRAHWLALAIAALVAAFAAAPASAALVRPQLVSPKPGAVLAIGSQPVFKVKDLGRVYDKALYISIATSKKRDRSGRLVATDVGTFAKMDPAGKKRWKWVPPTYDSPEWFMNRAGTYYWQAYHIDCRVMGCKVFSRVGKFIVR